MQLDSSEQQSGANQPPDEGQYEYPPISSGGAMNVLTAAAVAAKPTTPTASSSPQTAKPKTTSTTTPASSGSGKVVESGHEHTGRWTKEEHEAFLSALQLYGKEWKKVAARVKTRTVVQTRTHAQKYFQKLQKVMEVRRMCSCVS